jgi:hypothetical protein
MKMKIKTLIILVICLIALLQINFTIRKGSSDFRLIDIMKIALASSEDCGVQGSQPLTHPQTGALCTCNGQVIARQTCIDGGTSCSPITCE